MLSAKPSIYRPTACLMGWHQKAPPLNSSLEQTKNHMNDDPKLKVLDITKPNLSLWSRAVGFLHRQRELRIEDILKAAKKGKLDQLLTSYYTIYTDPLWQEKIQLCMDLKEAGLLQAEFRTDLDKTTPVFLDGEPRITIAGRE